MQSVTIRHHRVKVSVRLVVGAGTLVSANVSGVILDILAAGKSLPLAALVETFLVAACVLARVGQTVDATHVHRTLYTTPRQTTPLNNVLGFFEKVFRF